MRKYVYDCLLNNDLKLFEVNEPKPGIITLKNNYCSVYIDSNKLLFAWQNYIINSEPTVRSYSSLYELEVAIATYFNQLAWVYSNTNEVPGIYSSWLGKIVDMAGDVQ